MRIEPIHYHPYTLRPKARLNARVGARCLEGALIRWQGGHAALQPWPEFGHLPLARQLALWRAGDTTPLIERAKACCRIDAAARRDGRSLFQALKLPASHEYAPGAGRTVKIKCGSDIAAEADRIRDLSAAKLRLDFNASLTPDSFRQFAGRLDALTKARIDFIEDPFCGSPDEWKAIQAETPIDLASDWSDVVTARVHILKPTLQALRDYPGRIIFTSSMDHPLGQYFAAWEAASYYREHPEKAELCGLLSHRLFVPDAFIERVIAVGDRLVSPGGTGLGFDDLLARIPWKPLE